MADRLIPTDNMPCTICIGGDRYAARVVKVLSSKRILIKEMLKKYDGEEWSQRKDGEWRPKGCNRNSGYYLSLGVAEERRDPSF
jgi:hypothetical protein